MWAGSANESGFTLMELLIVVAIMSIVAGMAAPSFTTMIQGSTLSVGANDLAASLRLARSEAVKRGSRTSVCISNTSMSATPSCGGAGWDDGWVVYNDADADGTIDGGEDVIKVHEPLKFGFSSGASSAFTSFVSFNALGSATNNANAFVSGAVTLGYGAESKQIAIASNGRTKVQ